MPVPSSHAKVREACATIAHAVSQTSSGAAHAVQLMLRDPEFRRKAIEEAKKRVACDHVPRPSDEQRAAVKAVREAADLLAVHEGRRL